MASRLQILDATLANAMGTLGLDGVDPRAVDAVAVPAVETIRQLRTEFDKLTGTIAQQDDHLAHLDSQRKQTAAELAELLTAEHPPKEDDLVDARAWRDEGWRLVRGVWMDGSADPEAVEAWSNGASLEDAYESAVGGADEVADRLRKEANAVERRMSLERQLEEIDEGLTVGRQELESARAERDDDESAWARLWETVGIVPGPRGAMEKWRDDFRDCAQQSVEARRLAAEIGGLDETIARHQSDLVTSLASVGKQPPDGMSLLGLLDHADQVAAAAVAAHQEHAGLTKSCADAETRLRRHVAACGKAEEAMAAWRVDWVAAVTALGLGETASPKEATAVLSALSEITSMGRELGDLQRRISGIQRRNTAFTEGVAAALAKLDGHGDLADSHPDVAITTLARRLAAAQETAAEHRTTTEERESHEQSRIDADLRIAEANERISQMVAAAGVTDGAQLSEAIARSEEQAVLVGRIAQVEDDLRKATGLTVSEVESEAAKVAGVEIEPEIDELAREIEAMDEKVKLQGKVVGELTNKRSLIGTSGEAADAMTRAQQSMAAVARYGEEYVQVLLAKQLLEEQVAIYRDEHQGPLLARARELFRKLTLDRYLGLDTLSAPEKCRSEGVILPARAEKRSADVAVARPILLCFLILLWYMEVQIYLEGWPDWTSWKRGSVAYSSLPFPARYVWLWHRAAMDLDPAST